jgi:hypothetical protein
VPDHPAFLGPPVTSTAAVTDQATDVDDEALQRIVERALRNYLSASRDERLACMCASAKADRSTQCCF